VEYELIKNLTTFLKHRYKAYNRGKINSMFSCDLWEGWVC